MANKAVVEAIKLAVSAGGSFLLTRAVSKAYTVTKVMADKYPGMASAGVASGIFAGSVKMGKNIKDQSIRTGIQAGTGAAAMVGIANIAQIKKNLPVSVQNLLAGDQNPNVRILTPEQLQAAITVEAQRHANNELAKMGFIQEDSKQIAQNSDSTYEAPSTMQGEDIDDLMFGNSDIYSDFR